MDAVQRLQSIIDNKKEKLGDGLYLKLSNAIMEVHKMKTDLPIMMLFKYNELKNKFIHVCELKETLEQEIDELQMYNIELEKENSILKNEYENIEKENEKLKKQIQSLGFVKLDKIKCECGTLIHPLHMERHKNGKKHSDLMKTKQ